MLTGWLELLRCFRRLKVPLSIIILTARDGVNDRVISIEQDADDYMAKPFGHRELDIRINTLIRRCYGGIGNEIVIGRLVLNTHRQGVGRVHFVIGSQNGWWEQISNIQCC